MSYAVRFALGILCGLLLSVIAWGVLYASSFGFRATPHAHYIANWSGQKANIAARTASPRIVIGGGSNAFYGLSAKRISETFGVRAVNYATYGGLLLDYHLYKLRQILRPGDLLILPLEFEYYDPDDGPQDVCIEYVLGADPAYLGTLRFDQAVFWFLAPPSGLLTKRLFTSRATYQETLQRVTNQLKNFMNAFGDRAGHSSASMTEPDKEFIRTFPAHEFPKQDDCLRAEHPWRLLHDFSVWCKAHQITILAAYPNTIDDPSFHTDLGRRNLARIRKRFASIGVPMVGNGCEALRPRDDFYDSNYHLTEEGQKKRTDDFIALLHPFLEKWQASIPSRETQSRPPSTLRGQAAGSQEPGTYAARVR
jgi:hypothetical protein